MAGTYEQKNALTEAVAQHYKESMAKVKALPLSTSNKLTHEFFETQYGVVGKRGLDNWEEDFAEHYRLFHRELYRDRQEGTSKHMEQYRQRHPKMAKLFDAHYTAALLAQTS